MICCTYCGTMLTTDLGVRKAGAYFDAELPCLPATPTITYAWCATCYDQSHTRKLLSMRDSLIASARDAGMTEAKALKHVADVIHNVRTLETRRMNALAYLREKNALKES